MTHPPVPRDAERTKSAVLRAATTLFSRQGFDATTIGQIAQAAGVARATPSYFFGSKEGLWKAVLDAQNRAGLEVAPRALARLGPHPDAAELVVGLVDAYFEFLEREPDFFRLVQWSELQGNTLINELPSQWEAIARALEAVTGLLAVSAGLRGDPRQAVMSVIGMCSAHLLLGNTLGTPLGLDVTAAGFTQARKAHLKDLLTAALT